MLELRSTLVAMAMLCGCGERATAPEPTLVTRETPAPPPRALSRIDELFRGWQTQLPEPATLSEGNGASLECRHGFTTYTLLSATAKRVPIDTDADLLDLVPWAHDPDPCIRYIAIQAIVERIQLDTDPLSLPGMHEPDHHHFHEIFVALRRYLVGKQVRIPPRAFAGMYLDITSRDFATLTGTWREDAQPMRNFQTTVAIDREHVVVTSRRTQPDPAWPEHTWTTKIATVTVNERGQYVVAGEWNVESNANGYRGQPITPSQFTYKFWPTRRDILWFDENGGSWIELRRVTR